MTFPTAIALSEMEDQREQSLKAWSELCKAFQGPIFGDKVMRIGFQDAASFNSLSRQMKEELLEHSRLIKTAPHEAGALILSTLLARAVSVGMILERESHE